MLADPSVHDWLGRWGFFSPPHLFPNNFYWVLQLMLTYYLGGVICQSLIHAHDKEGTINQINCQLRSLETTRLGRPTYPQWWLNHGGTYIQQIAQAYSVQSWGRSTLYSIEVWQSPHPPNFIDKDCALTRIICGLPAQWTALSGNFLQGR